MSSIEAEPAEDNRWEYLVVPLADARNVGKADPELSPDRLNELGAQGWEAVGVTLKGGDLLAWPVVLMKRRGR